MVDYATGGPVARQKVQLQRSKNYYDAKYSTVATAITDAQGFFAFGAEGVKDRYEFDWRLVTQYKGLEVVSNCSIGPNERDTVRYRAGRHAMGRRTACVRCARHR